jgi:hypothetical protein
MPSPNLMKLDWGFDPHSAIIEKWPGLPGTWRLGIEGAWVEVVTLVDHDTGQPVTRLSKRDALAEIKDMNEARKKGAN